MNQYCTAFVVLLLVAACSDDSPSVDPDAEPDATIDTEGDAEPGDDADDGRDSGGRDVDATPDPDVDEIRPEPDALPDLDPDAEVIDVTNVELVQNPSNALSYYVSWRTAQATSSRLDVDCDEGDYRATIRSDATAELHEVFLMGLYEGASCELTMSGGSADGGRAQSTETLEVGSLPEFLPEVVIETPAEPGVSPGWTMFNLSNQFDGIPMIGAMIDRRGRYRWYHQRRTEYVGADTEVFTTPEGVFFGGREPVLNPGIVNWEGGLVWEGDFNQHHDIRVLNETQLLYLDFGGPCPPEFGAIESDRVRIWDRSSNAVTWTWRVCDHVTPDPMVTDWSHLNTVEPFPGNDRYIMLSSRNQHTLYRLDRDTGEIEWSIGQNGSFTLVNADDSPDTPFFRQHAPEIQADGNILIFDNGLRDFRDFSRAVEIAYDEGSNEAWAVWEYRHDPDIFAPIWGDADRLANGNVLITFGVRDSDPRFISHLVEATPDSDTVWDVSMPVRWGVYRAERVAEPPVGYVIVD